VTITLAPDSPVDRKRTEPLRHGSYYGWELAEAVKRHDEEWQRSIREAGKPSRLPSPVLWATIGIVIAAIALGFLCAL
jgi:hypothetical protein